MQAELEETEAGTFAATLAQTALFDSHTSLEATTTLPSSTALTWRPKRRVWPWLAGGLAAALAVVALASARAETQALSLDKFVDASRYEEPARPPETAPVDARAEVESAPRPASEEPAADAHARPTPRPPSKPQKTPKPQSAKTPVAKASSSSGDRPRDERCYTLDEHNVWHIRPECL
jgi:hypothetical protein